MGVLLYTERAHFYRRQAPRGATRVFFYSLPRRADFYAEVVNRALGAGTGAASMSTEGVGAEVGALYTRYDVREELARIVGDLRASRMASDDVGTFVFV